MVQNTKKRGEISMSFVAGIVLLLIGFGILFLFYQSLYKAVDINRTACHTSVIGRATLPALAQGYVPLKCTTAKICITGKKSEKCEEFLNSESVTTAVVKNSPEGINQIQAIYANEIISCWAAMGEGRVDVFPDYVQSQLGLGNNEPGCVICSRIAIEKDSLNQVDFSKMDLVKYMDSHTLPGKKETYVEYLSKNKNAAPVRIGEDVQIVDAEGNIIDSDDKWNNNKEAEYEETAILFAQLSDTPGYFEGPLNGLKTIFKGATISTVISPLATVYIGKTIITEPLAWVAILVAGGYQEYSIYKNRAFSAGYCGDVQSADKDKTGCSAIRTVHYNAPEILEYCGTIESIG